MNLCFDYIKPISTKFIKYDNSNFMILKNINNSDIFYINYLKHELK